MDASPSEILAGWLQVQDSLAEKTGVSLTTLNSQGATIGSVYNENSICRAMRGSPEFASLCTPDCGRAFNRATTAGGAVEFRCHAGLHCFAAPFKLDQENLALLGGHAFKSTADYAQFLRRYNDLPGVASGKALKNVRFMSGRDLQEAQELVLSATHSHARQYSAPPTGPLEAPSHLLDAHLEIVRLTDELAGKTQALAQLSEFLREVTLGFEHAGDFSTILAKMSALMKAERASLMLVDEESGDLGVYAACGFDLPRVRVKLGEPIAGTVLARGIPMIVRDVDAEVGLARPHRAGYKTKSFISFPIKLGNRNIGVINLSGRVDGEVYGPEELSLLELMAPHLALMIDRSEWHKKAEEFQQMSLTDPLTGLPNRRYLEERLFEEVERAKRHGTPLAFMLIDVDRFKSYNDAYGHTSADRVLIKTAQALKKCIRTIDMSARYAGDEFCVILPETELRAAAGIAERLRAEVGRTDFKSEHGSAISGVTISIGVSSFGPARQSPLAIIESADRALYRAKTRGRNCVVVYDESPIQSGRLNLAHAGDPSR